MESRLRELRERAKLTRQQLADCTGCSKETIKKAETIEDYIKNMQTPILSCIADYFHVSIDYLIGRSDYRNIGDNEIQQLLHLSPDALYHLRSICTEENADRMNFILNPELPFDELVSAIYNYSTSGAIRLTNNMIYLLKENFDSIINQNNGTALAIPPLPFGLTFGEAEKYADLINDYDYEYPSIHNEIDREAFFSINDVMGKYKETFSTLMKYEKVVEQWEADSTRSQDLVNMIRSTKDNLQMLDAVNHALNETDHTKQTIMFERIKSVLDSLATPYTTIRKYDLQDPTELPEALKSEKDHSSRIENEQETKINPEWMKGFSPLDLNITEEEIQKHNNKNTEV